jgi:hypothetical protein
MSSVERKEMGERAIPGNAKNSLQSPITFWGEDGFVGLGLIHNGILLTVEHVASASTEVDVLGHRAKLPKYLVVDEPDSKNDDRIATYFVRDLKLPRAPPSKELAACPKTGTGVIVDRELNLSPCVFHLTNANKYGGAHDGSTTFGDSGSPILSNGKVVGLHTARASEMIGGNLFLPFTNSTLKALVGDVHVAGN